MESIVQQLSHDSYDANTQFVKNDAGKIEWSLIPFEQMKEVAKVLMKGAEKYSVDNWKKCDDIKRYKDALLRHVLSYVGGEKIDGEDNLSHLAHAVCNCLFMMWFDDNTNPYANELELDK